MQDLPRKTCKYMYNDEKTMIRCTSTILQMCASSSDAQGGSRCSRGEGKGRWGRKRRKRLKHLRKLRAPARGGGQYAQDLEGLDGEGGQYAQDLEGLDGEGGQDAQDREGLEEVLAGGWTATLGLLLLLLLFLLLFFLFHRLTNLWCCPRKGFPLNLLKPRPGHQPRNHLVPLLWQRCLFLETQSSIVFPAGAQHIDVNSMCLVRPSQWA